VFVRAKPGKKTKHGIGSSTGGAPKIVVAVKPHVISNGKGTTKATS